jgi:cytochrome c peroxidase
MPTRRRASKRRPELPDAVAAAIANKPIEDSAENREALLGAMYFRDPEVSEAERQKCARLFRRWTGGDAA